MAADTDGGDATDLLGYTGYLINSWDSLGRVVSPGTMIERAGCSTLAGVGPAIAVFVK